jgi:hypothetical protein
MAVYSQVGKNLPNFWRVTPGSSANTTESEV